tara:strand:- start:20 stop:610 length:591 start_codon:yes stop_codon:yes gene_type:complete
MEYSTTASSLFLLSSFAVLLVVLFCTKNSSSEREAAAVHLVSASVDAKSQKRWRIVAGTNEVEEVFALFDVDFVFFFVVVPDAPPIIIIIIYYSLTESTQNNSNESAFFVCAWYSRASVVFFQRERKCIINAQKSVARRFGSFLLAPRKSRSSIHPSIRPPGHPKSLQKSKQNFFLPQRRARERNVIPTTPRVICS